MPAIGAIIGIGGDPERGQRRGNATDATDGSDGGDADGRARTARTVVHPRSR
jgi:hypothetical protein